MDYVVFTGGGTGGHVFPGLAVAQEFAQKYSIPMVWLGSGKGIEKSLVESSGIPGLRFRSIPSGKLRRYLSFQNLVDLFRIAFGFMYCLALFIPSRPLVVFSKGGYVTVPPVWAAGMLRIPVFSHESDFDPGLATRLNLPFTRKLFVAYQETREFIKPKHQEKITVSGNPIRSAILQGEKSRITEYYADRPKDLPLILVLGGSLGAIQVNTLVAHSLDQLEGKAWIVHQHGDQWQPPQTRPGFYYPTRFLGPELPHLLAGASLSIARAGAGTLWELAAWKVPAILVPLNQGSRGDQIRNAKYFENLGSCIMVIDPIQEDFNLAVQSLIKDPDLRTRMAQAYGGLPTKASTMIAHELTQVLEQGVDR